MDKALYTAIIRLLTNDREVSEEDDLPLFRAEYIVQKYSGKGYLLAKAVVAYRRQQWRKMLEAIGDEEKDPIAMYLRGFDASQSAIGREEEAIQWFTLASQQGMCLATVELMKLLSSTGKDGPVVAQVIREANHGCIPAQVWLAIKYHHEKDYAKSFSFWDMAQKRRNMYATFKTAQSYQYGVGVETDIKEAYVRYSRAAEWGLPEAKMRVAVMVLRGIAGDKKDRLAFLSLSDLVRNEILEEGSTELAEALFELGRCYENGIGVDKDDEKAAECYENMSIEEDDDEDKEPDRESLHRQDLLRQAHYRLHRMYRHGRGVVRDDDTSFSHLQRSAHMLYCPAANDLGIFYLGLAERSIVPGFDQKKANDMKKDSHQQTVIDQKTESRIKANEYIRLAYNAFSLCRFKDANCSYHAAKVLLDHTQLFVYHDPSEARDLLVFAAQQGHIVAKEVHGRLYSSTK